MKRFAMAVVLAGAVSGTALAGDIPSSGIQSPAPPPDETTQPGEVPTTGFTLPGNIPTDGVSLVLMTFDLVF